MTIATAEKCDGLGNQQPSRFPHTINRSMMMRKVQRLGESHRAKRPEMRGLYVPAARPIAERFAEKVQLHPNGCLEWTGAIMPGGPRTVGGYGQIHFNGRTAYAHHVAWELINGSIPEGAQIMHTCDNRRCVNVAHLRLGTRQDNMNDMTGKLRHAHGERNAHAKLTATKVRQIQAAKGTQREIAERFGVTQPLVSMIRAGRIWKHV